MDCSSPHAGAGSSKRSTSPTISAFFSPKPLARPRPAGTQIGSMGAMIAGHAVAAGAVLITNNARYFSQVAGLTVENWSQGH